MRAILAMLFKRHKASEAQDPEKTRQPKARKYRPRGKGRGSLPGGARRIDPNGPIIAQARGRRYG